MVMAKLHVICGNCGCNDDFVFSVIQEKAEDGYGEGSYVSIECNNCNTIHDLNDNLK